MSGASRVFIARLIGVSVFDPGGDQVGRIRDVLVTLRESNRPPRVIGLVVEVQPRRRIFLPMTRITSVDAGGVVASGLVNLRRFEQRPGEILAVGELLDSSVSLTGSVEGAGETVTLLDLGMEQLRTRDWEISKVYVQRRGKTLRRRGEQFITDWDAISGLTIDETDQSAASLIASFENLRAADVAHMLQDLSTKRRSEVVAALDDDRLADILEEMEESDSIEILARLKEERAADVLEAMDPDDAADVLNNLTEASRHRLLALMEPDEADDVRRLLDYDDNTAGGLMTPEPVILAPDSTVAEALARIRNSDLPPALAAQVYVCRPPLEVPTGRYLGAVHFQRLLREPPGALVSEVIDSELSPVQPDASLQSVTSELATYNLVAIPVVNSNDRLLGAITVDDVIDHMLPDNWRRSADTSGESSTTPDTSGASHGA